MAPPHRPGTYATYTREPTNGERLRELRLAAGLTQRELGALLHYSQQTLSRVERNGDTDDTAADHVVAAALALHHSGLKELPWLRRGTFGNRRHPLGRRLGKGRGRGPRPFGKGQGRLVRRRKEPAA